MQPLRTKIQSQLRDSHWQELLDGMQGYLWDKLMEVSDDNAIHIWDQLEEDDAAA